MTQTFHLDDRVLHHLIKPIEYGTVKGMRRVGHTTQYWVVWDNAKYEPDWYRGSRLLPVATTTVTYSITL